MNNRWRAQPNRHFLHSPTSLFIHLCFFLLPASSFGFWMHWILERIPSIFFFFRIASFSPSFNFYLWYSLCSSCILFDSFFFVFLLDPNSISRTLAFLIDWLYQTFVAIVHEKEHRPFSWVDFFFFVSIWISLKNVSF